MGIISLIPFMGWECFMSDIVHGGITEPCSSLWRRGNGHLVSLRTYSSCVLVRSGIEREGVDDMDLVGAAVTLDRAAMGWSNRGFFILRPESAR
jgi:hypothetical protein